MFDAVKDNNIRRKNKTLIQIYFHLSFGIYYPEPFNYRITEIGLSMDIRTILRRDIYE
jgi:hypothetical protein